MAKSTVNRYIQNDMVGSAPLARGYEGIIPKAIFKLLVLAIKSFIQIKQVNCEVIVRKQLLVAVNKLCGITSGDHIKENMLERVMQLTTVSLDVTITPAVKKRRLLCTTRDNLHTWFLGFKEFLLKFGFATLDDNTGELILPTKIWRFSSGGRVCFHQKWSTWQIKELYISSLLATEETTIWATLLDGRMRTRPI